MNFWEFADRTLARMPGWPSEKQLVMLTTFFMAFFMLMMTFERPTLWNIELFKTLITVVIATGCINMILGFYFIANKHDEDKVKLDTARAETTKQAFDVISSVTGTTPDDTIREGDEVVIEKK